MPPKYASTDRKDEPRSTDLAEVPTSSSSSSSSSSSHLLINLCPMDNTKTDPAGCPFAFAAPVQKGLCRSFQCDNTKDMSATACTYHQRHNRAFLYMPGVEASEKYEEDPDQNMDKWQIIKTNLDEAYLMQIRTLITAFKNEKTEDLRTDVDIQINTLLSSSMSLPDILKSLQKLYDNRVQPPTRKRTKAMV